MKKLLVTLSIIAALGFNANAQQFQSSSSDGFFSYNTEESSRTEFGAMPKIPGRNINTDQDAPVGSGLLILAGLGVAYAVRRRK